MSKKILIFIDWFYPAYKAGGPIKSVFNIIENLKNEINFLVVTSNQDVDGELLAVIPNQLIDRVGYQVIYLDANHQKKKKYKELFETFKADTLYYNSVFSKNFTLKPLLYFRKESVKQIIAPRGMLGKGALAIKPLKKQLFLKLANQLLRKNKNIEWHASSKQEELEVKAVFGSTIKVKVAQNLSATAVKRTLPDKFKQKDSLELIFISRISGKKNLLFCLELMQELKQFVGLSLRIYGPVEEEGYWKQCLKIINNDGRICYKGVLSPADIPDTLQQAHFFILPTRHENFGHAIAESINAGVPVMLSDQTPWLNLEENNIGFDLPLSNKERWVYVIKQLIELDQLTYQKMVEACYVTL